MQHCSIRAVLASLPGEQSPAASQIPAASVAFGATAAADNEPSAAAVSEPNAAVVSQEDLFGKDRAEIELAIEEASGNEALDQLDARIVGVRKVGSSRVAITLDNEQVWRQTQSSSLRLSEGDEIVISKASMGSHMLRKVGSNRAMRVERVD